MNAMSVEIKKSRDHGDLAELARKESSENAVGMEHLWSNLLSNNPQCIHLYEIGATNDFH